MSLSATWAGELNLAGSKVKGGMGSGQGLDLAPSVQDPGSLPLGERRGCHEAGAVRSQAAGALTCSLTPRSCIFSTTCSQGSCKLPGSVKSLQLAVHSQEAPCLQSPTGTEG